MNTISKLFLMLLISVSMLSIVSCDDKDDDDVISDTGKLNIKFNFLVDGNPLKFDTIAYVNAAGNPFSITEIKFFISRVKLYKNGGTVKEINAWKTYHYVDNFYPSTLSWDVYDDIASGSYDSVSFTFGFDSLDNKSYMFVNAPEVNMEWPEVLGGGFHYMQMNGYYKNPTSDTIGYGFHLGIGQIYDNNGNITGFVHNHFRAQIPSSSFTITKGATTTINLNMNIEEWFKNPHIFDFNVYGGDIMQKQEAMHKVSENGVDVFSIGL